MQPAALQHPLAIHVSIPFLHAVPLIPIAFDGQPPSHSLDEKIDALTRQFELRDRAKAAIDDLKEDINLEPAIKWEGGSGICALCFQGLLAQLQP